MKREAKFSCDVVGDQGIEPCTSRSQSEHSTVELVPVLTCLYRITP